MRMTRSAIVSRPTTLTSNPVSIGFCSCTTDPPIRRLNLPYLLPTFALRTDLPPQQRHPVFPSSTCLTPARFSQVTSHKAHGYYRLPDARKIPIDEGCYEVRAVRGSGPGGQGTNSSSNKIELRLDLELFEMSLEDLASRHHDAAELQRGDDQPASNPTTSGNSSSNGSGGATSLPSSMLPLFADPDFRHELVENLRRNEKLMERQAERNAHVLIASSHEHRSALQNKEECLAKVREMIRKASWVPPVEADPIQTPSRTITQEKNERRRKSNMNKMRRTARQGLW